MDPRFMVYDADKVNSQPDHNEFMFRFPDGSNAYVKVGHNLLSHTKGERISIDGREYVVSADAYYSYSQNTRTGDYELVFVAVELEEVK